jgi:hypothetical protein
MFFIPLSILAGLDDPNHLLDHALVFPDAQLRKSLFSPDEGLVPMLCIRTAQDTVGAAAYFGEFKLLMKGYNFHRSYQSRLMQRRIGFP